MGTGLVSQSGLRGLDQSHDRVISAPVTDDVCLLRSIGVRLTSRHAVFHRRGLIPSYPGITAPATSFPVSVSGLCPPRGLVVAGADLRLLATMRGDDLHFWRGTSHRLRISLRIHHKGAASARPFSTPMRKDGSRSLVVPVSPGRPPCRLRRQHPSALVSSRLASPTEGLPCTGLPVLRTAG